MTAYEGNGDNDCHPLSPQGALPIQVNQTSQEAILRAPSGESQV